jgi:hypothetical protein
VPRPPVQNRGHFAGHFTDRESKEKLFRNNGSSRL